MDTNERQQEKQLTIDKNAQINVVVNRPDSDETEIDLGRVFHTMKLKRRIYAWVLVLCLVAGVCAPLVLYQFTKPMLTVSSAATLTYDVATRYTVNGQTRYTYSPVTDLTAPDGTPLDLSQITSSYVLQNALNGLDLSYAVSLSNLRANIKIERILSEQSRQAQELAAKMTEDKNAAAYTQTQSVKLVYEPKFVVSLTNGFGDEDSKEKHELKDEELRLVLNRILEAYNDYLVRTYADLKLPDDEIAVIDTDHLDYLESLEMLRTAADDLYEYCENKPEAVRAYRSWQTGHSLNDWMQTLQIGREVSIEYLYSNIYTNSIAKDKKAVITNYQYQLRNAETQLDTMNNQIETLKSILKNYKNDEIFVSMQESDSSKATSTTTDYFNKLILEQASNYRQAVKTEITIVELQDKINSLTDTDGKSSDELSVLDDMKKELDQTMINCQMIFDRIKAHMEELHASSFYTTYLTHTAAQGKQSGFLASSSTNMIIGAVAGLVIACGLWFLGGLMPEFSRNIDKKEKEAMVDEH